MLKIRYSSKFENDYKRIKKRKYNLSKLKTVISMLQNREPLPKQYRDHGLTGNYKGYRECYIEPDWLLVYRIDEDVLILTLFRTGSHSDLF